MLAGGRNSRCNPLDDSPLSFALCVSFSLVCPHPRPRAGASVFRAGSDSLAFRVAGGYEPTLPCCRSSFLPELTCVCVRGWGGRGAGEKAREGGAAGGQPDTRRAEAALRGSGGAEKRRRARRRTAGLEN